MSGKIIVFLSWASDNPNLSKLKKSVKDAVSELDSIHYRGNSYQYEESTLNCCGSPDIIQTVLAKIEESDVFIADITQFYKLDQGTKYSANPNVVFEYGYAQSILGNQRCITLIDNSQPLANMLAAFDIRGYRHSPLDFSLSQKDKIRSFIEKIIDNDPPYPIKISSEQIQVDKTIAQQLIDPNKYDIIGVFNFLVNDVAVNRSLSDVFLRKLINLFSHCQEPTYSFSDYYLEKASKMFVSSLNDFLNKSQELLGPAGGYSCDFLTIHSPYTTPEQIQCFDQTITELIDSIDTFCRLIRKRLNVIR